jgi:hypothetical protein
MVLAREVTMNGWLPISTAPDDRTVLGRTDDTRFLMEQFEGDWFLKQTTDPEDWVLDTAGDRIIAEPDLWCEVP